ncbi:MAG: hypothetical protein Q7T20_12585 [Saprospiraceae bacterium]|nr:hypothetical protein [Saprospiraceae bacterium]
MRYFFAIDHPYAGTSVPAWQDLDAQIWQLSVSWVRSYKILMILEILVHGFRAGGDT